ncbi:hypothetical protein V5P93_007197 [Actinokineospora auranticolor]|uniref:Uncharacterized protein n=1 Tax=Actinokineospora auranticolor TaxID=155976 RepID=A0A2S6GRH0_9PSEU|nr:hypothetical protein [Actinokineospora auranticolor]PPK67855.1 hypothetical protein CLV40_10685 [Actinokineospora auranticolor]
MTVQTKEQAIAVAEAWLRDRYGPELTSDGEPLRIKEPGVHRESRYWWVPYELDGSSGNAFMPPRTLLVHVDGSEVEHLLMSPHAPVWLLPALWPEPSDADLAWAAEHPGEEMVVVDPEWDREEFPGLEVPQAAVLGWRLVGTDGQPTDRVRVNPHARSGMTWRGLPAPTSRMDKLVRYYWAQWLHDLSGLAAILDSTVYLPLKDNGAVRLVKHPDGVRAEAWSSLDMLPSGTRSWYEINLRDALLSLAVDVDEIVVNPGHVLSFDLNSTAVEHARDLPRATPEQPVVVVRAPETRVDDTWLGLSAEDAEFVRGSVVAAADQARAHGRHLDERECVEIATCLAAPCTVAPSRCGRRRSTRSTARERLERWAHPRSARRARGSARAAGSPGTGWSARSRVWRWPSSTRAPSASARSPPRC